MASLRDVLNHAGKKVRVTDRLGTSRDGLAMRRGDVVIIEPHLSPQDGETLEFVETGERFQLVDPQPQEGQGKVDHYRARVAPVARG